MADDIAVPPAGAALLFVCVSLLQLQHISMDIAAAGSVPGSQPMQQELHHPTSRFI
jgi:hypothetical protein